MSCSWLRKVPADGYCGDAPAVERFILTEPWKSHVPKAGEHLTICNVSRLEELPDNKHGTTSGYHSAEWPVAGSKEEYSQCWLLSNALGACPRLKNNTDHDACQWHRPAKAVSSATLHRHCKALLGHYYPKWMILLTRKQPAELQL